MVGNYPGINWRINDYIIKRYLLFALCCLFPRILSVNFEDVSLEAAAEAQRQTF